MSDKSQMENKLLTNIKNKLPELKVLMEEINSHWGYEDPVYRFYHQSFKVYSLQEQTKKIISALQSIAPMNQCFCEEFQEIIDSGTSGKKFKLTHNRNWTSHTRVFLEAFFHAKYFLEMAVKYGNELDNPPSMLPSGWAALLCLYNIK